ncbi:restriction endonuclease subunit S [Psychrobacter sanguinis]|uniref:restriction endonuclease subunit S n=1 Tax=Psychrobacter sanguinis TaxID=861445 RepID=UPI002897A6D5|nr:restriction endonuclease subunit S [Psychrobacter sanguinis]
MADNKAMQSGRYKAYPEYNDSGVEWLGGIPSGWQLSKIKYTAPFQVGWTPSTSKDSNFVGDNLWANISDLGPKTIHDTTKRISDIAAKESSMDITPAGSLLYSFKLSVGTVSFAGCDMYTNEAIASFTSLSKLPLSYLYYTLPQFVIKNASTNIYGARILNQELIRNAIVLEPSYKEAEKIANFLDHETAKIDILIEKQQRLIELLTEKRQAVISHAVTKGLNPDVPMKDSGVEWLGEVPEHWEVKSLKYVARLRSLKTQPSATRYVGLENVESDTGKYLATEDLMPTGISNVFDKDNLLFGKLRPYLAKSWLATFSGICSSEFLVLESILVHPKYLNYLTLSNRFIDEVNSSTYGSKMPRASWDFISLMPIPTMDYDTSKDIAEFLDEELIKFDEVISKANQQIQLMQERRTALISAAVTGKIDVRDWVKPE